MATDGTDGDLLAVSDLHVAYEENRAIVERLRPRSEADWLIVAGDVGDVVEDVERTLTVLSRRFARVVWVPGNHELWTLKRDRHPLRGVARYEHLVEVCRGLGVLTPEDPYPVWTGARGSVRIAPLFTLYDYSFLTPGTSTPAESMAAARAAGVVCSDEHLLHPDPHPTREAWCHARVSASEQRLAAVAGDLPLVLVNHWPLVREPTRVLRHPQFAQWCGTERTADWHTRFGAALVVYGHLHVPRTTTHDGVRFEEVSIGYPREWGHRGLREDLARVVLPGART